MIFSPTEMAQFPNKVKLFKTFKCLSGKKTKYGWFFLCLCFQDLVRCVHQQVEEQSTTNQDLQITLQKQSWKNEQQSVTIDKQSALIEVNYPYHSQVFFVDLFKSAVCSVILGCNKEM